MNARQTDALTIRLPNAEFPFAPHYQRVNGHRIHYLEEGVGDPILMLHGNPSWSYGWRHIVPGLSRIGRVVAPDNIGMGRSDKPLDLSYDYFEHLRYLEAFVDALDLRNVTLVGHDWGAFLGLSLLRRHPWRFNDLVLLDPFSFKLSMGPMGQGFNTDPRRLSWHPASMAMCLRIIDPVDGLKAIFEEDIFNRVGVQINTRRRLSAEEMDGYAAPYSDSPSRRAQWLWPGQAIRPSRELMREADLVQEHVCSQNAMPKLLITASEALIGPTEARWFDANVPNLTITYVGEANHWCHEDEPQATLDAIRVWAKPRRGP